MKTYLASILIVLISASVHAQNSSSFGGGANGIALPVCNNTVTVTGAVNSALTLTLPASSGNFHYITSIYLTRYAGAAMNTASTPIVVSTTDLGSQAFSFSTVGALGSDEIQVFSMLIPWRSATAGTATTFTFPAITGVIWRAFVRYYVAP